MWRERCHPGMVMRLNVKRKMPFNISCEYKCGEKDAIQEWLCRWMRKGCYHVTIRWQQNSASSCNGDTTSEWSLKICLSVPSTAQKRSEWSKTTLVVSPVIRPRTFRHPLILVNLARDCSARTFLDFPPVFSSIFAGRLCISENGACVLLANVFEKASTKRVKSVSDGRYRCCVECACIFDALWVGRYVLDAVQGCR